MVVIARARKRPWRSRPGLWIASSLTLLAMTVPDEVQFLSNRTDGVDLGA
jgi:hypothetical protein